MTPPPAAGTPPDENRNDASGRRSWRPTIGIVLSLGFGLLVLVAVSSVLFVALGAAQKNTFSLVRRTAEITVESLIDEIANLLGAAREQTVFLAGAMGRGDIAVADRERLIHAMLGSLAAAPQVAGVAFFSSEGWSQRVGRRPGGTMQLFDRAESVAGIEQLVADMEHRDGPHWGGIFWVPSLDEPHMTVSAAVHRNDAYLGVVTAVVSVQVLSNHLDEFELETGLHAFVLYGNSQVLAHPAMARSLPGLGPSKPLPDLDEVGDPYLASLWADDRLPVSLLQGSRSAMLGHMRRLPDDEVFYFYRVVGGYGPRQLYIGLYALDSESEGSEFDRLILAGWVGLAILVLSLLTAVVLGRGIARPVRDLAEAARAISSFDFRRVPQAKHSAFRELDNAADAFNAMLSGLRWFETYVPRSLVLRLVRLGEDGVRSEERQITVIFTDIVGFTAASQQLTPRETADFLNHHFALLAAEIERTGGTVDKYIGDSVMAFWGAPDDQPDHAERACRAALAIAAALERDNRRRAERGLPAVRIRLGVHSGPAIVGNIGAPGRVNYTLIGDSVNLANRLEAFGKEIDSDDAAAVVLLSEATRALIGPGWRVEDLGAHQMRGRVGRIGVFRLLGEDG